MTQRTIETILDRFIDGVKDVLGSHLEQVILYGSYARGDYNEHSDIDVMILVDLDENEKDNVLREISDIAFDLNLEYDVLLSPVVKNINYFKGWTNILPFFSNVANEGVVLHG